MESVIRRGGGGAGAAAKVPCVALAMLVHVLGRGVWYV